MHLFETALAEMCEIEQTVMRTALLLIVFVFPHPPQSIYYYKAGLYDTLQSILIVISIFNNHIESICDKLVAAVGCIRSECQIASIAMVYPH